MLWSSWIGRVHLLVPCVDRRRELFMDPPMDLEVSMYCFPELEMSQASVSSGGLRVFCNPMVFVEEFVTTHVSVTGTPCGITEFVRLVVS